MSAVENIKLHYPLIIAKLHQEMRLETEPRERIRKLINLFEGTSQYLVLVGLASYLHQNLADSEVENLRAGLNRPSLGHWIGLLKALNRCLLPNDPKFLSADPGHYYKNEPIGVAVKVIREIISLDGFKNVRLYHFLDTVVEFRNKKIGHGELSLVEAGKIKDPLEEALNQWLGELSTLYERHLYYISEVKLQKQNIVYFGTQLNAGTSLESFQLDGKINLDDKCVYLHLPATNTYMPLSPFFVYNPETQVLYTYNDISSKGEVRLRRLYTAHGTEEWLTLTIDKLLVLGSASTTEVISPTGPATVEILNPTTMSPEQSMESDVDNIPLHDEISKNHLESQSFEEKELVQTKKDSLQKTWDRVQKRIEDLTEDWINETRRDEKERIRSEIKKSESLQTEIEPQLNDLISKLKKFDEVQSQRAAQKIKHQTDAEQSSQGLSLLSQMMQYPKVHAVMVRSRDNFERASKQIDLMGNYKNIHDSLHKLEFECFRPIYYQEMPHFPKKSDFSALDLYLLVLSGVKSRIQDIVETGSIPQKEDALLNRLGEAEQTLTQSLATKDRKMFDRAVRHIAHVLSYDLSRINQRLSDAAASLSLLDLIEGMMQVKNHLINYQINTVEMHIIEKGIQALENLSSLTSRTKEHSDWQEISDGLRLTESNLQSAIDQWPLNKERLDRLCGDITENFENQTRELCKELDKAIDAQETNKQLLELFRKLNQRAGLRFQEVDIYLMDLCDQVKKLDQPITSIVNQMI